MRNIAALCLLVLVVGCATYQSEYRVGQSVATDPEQGAKLIAKAANSAIAVQTSPTDTPTALIHSVAPKMRARAIDQRIEGEVAVEFLVNERGSVTSVRILSSPNPVLSEAVQEALLQWQFTPKQSQGKPVQFIGRQTFAFKVEE